MRKREEEGLILRLGMPCKETMKVKGKEKDDEGRRSPFLRLYSITIHPFQVNFCSCLSLRKPRNEGR